MRGNGGDTVEERDEGDTSLDVFLVQSNFQLIYQLLEASREGRFYFSCFGLLVRRFSPSQINAACTIDSIRMLHILDSYSPPREQYKR